jgi:hypothetical protein
MTSPTCGEVATLTARVRGIGVASLARLPTRYPAGRMRADRAWPMVVESRLGASARSTKFPCFRFWRGSPQTASLLARPTVRRGCLIWSAAAARGCGPTPDCPGGSARSALVPTPGRLGFWGSACVASSASSARHPRRCTARGEPRRAAVHADRRRSRRAGHRRRGPEGSRGPRRPHWPLADGLRRRAGMGLANPDDDLDLRHALSGYISRQPRPDRPSASASGRCPGSKGLIMANGQVPGRMPFRWTGRQRRMAWPGSPRLMDERRNNGRRPAADAFDRSWD